MDARSLLDQLFGSAKDMVAQGKDLAEQKLGVPEGGEQRDAMLSGMGKGALAAGALALLLGTGSGRRLTGGALKLGGLAAVGGLAYKAYKNWQQGESQAAAEPGTPIDQLTGPQADTRSQTLLKAMISAAKADGHIDDQEQAKIHEQMGKLDLGADASRFLLAEVGKPVDLQALASEADSVETAAEIYLASLLVIDVDDARERKYLDELANALNLPAGLAAQLEAEVQA